MKHTFLPVLLMLCLSCAGQQASQTQNEISGDSKANVVIIFADDMGYGDIGSFGQKTYTTPHIDKLADDGVRFTSFYVSQPVCSASRAALLTGNYSNRIGIHGALGPSAKHGISDDELTLAEMFKSIGYNTAAYGKWHLGHHPQFLPTRHGFDDFYGIPYSNDMWPFHPENPEHWVDLPTIEMEKTIGLNTDQTRFTTDFTNRATDFIKDSAAKDEPFFVYLAHPMPHVPIFVSEERKGHSGSGLYGDVIKEIDWSVGQIVETLDALGLSENTLVMFASDNGPWLSYGDHAGTTGPLREGKGTTFEGGVRVPAAMKWPARIPKNTIAEQPVMTIDVLPTLAAQFDAELPKNKIDGKDIWPIVTGEKNAESPHDAYFFYYEKNQLQALRSGKWKLHLPHGYRTMIGRDPAKDGIPGKYDYDVSTKLELYDLESDLGETQNVVDDNPEVIKRLLGLVEDMRDELGDSKTSREGSGNREPGKIG